MPAENRPSPEPPASSGLVPGDAAPAEPAGPAGAAPDAGPADVKAKFLDALQRKKSQHADGVGGAGPNAAKIRDVHSRVGGKRQFRRKSGG